MFQKRKKKTCRYSILSSGTVGMRGKMGRGRWILGGDYDGGRGKMRVIKWQETDNQTAIIAAERRSGRKESRSTALHLRVSEVSVMIKPAK